MFWKYYKAYFKRVAEETKKSLKLDLKDVAFSLASLVSATLIIHYLFGLQTVFENLAWAVAGLAGFFVLSLLFLTYHLVQTHVIMFDELGGFDKPRLKMTVQYDKGEHPERWFRILIHNDSSEDIEHCVVDLTKVQKDGEILDIPALSLAWSREEKQEIKIEADWHATVDIAHSDHVENAVVFTTWSRKTYKGETPGIYKIGLTFRGRYVGRKYERDFDIQFEYLGGTEFGCTDKYLELELENA